MTFKTNNHGFRSLMYRSGWLYNAITRRLYDQDKKFLTISKLIGKGPKKVVDLPCGTGYLMRFLHPLIEYEGVDLNKRFLRRIKKNELRKRKINLKKITLVQKDIFDFQGYDGERVDVIVISDILHHVYPKHEALINIAKKNAQKVILCEPYAVNPKEVTARDRIFKLIIYFGKFLPKSLYRIIDFLFLDNDGINSYHKRCNWNFNLKSLKEFYKTMGFNRVLCLLDEYVGVWESIDSLNLNGSSNN